MLFRQISKVLLLVFSRKPHIILGMSREKARQNLEAAQDYLSRHQLGGALGFGALWLVAESSERELERRPNNAFNFAGRLLCHTVAEASFSLMSELGSSWFHFEQPIWIAASEPLEAPEAELTDSPLLAE